VAVLPDPVTIKTDENEIGPVMIKPFFIAKYQVTYAQYRAFVEAEDGFRDDRWWQGMPERYQKQELASQRTKNGNNPRDSVSWYQSVAFARWLDAKYRELGLFERLLPSPQTPCMLEISGFQYTDGTEARSGDELVIPQGETTCGRDEVPR